VKKARKAAKAGKKKHSHKEMRKLCGDAAKVAINKLLKEQDVLVTKFAKKWAAKAVDKYPPKIIRAREDDSTPNNFVAPPSIHLFASAKPKAAPKPKAHAKKKAAPKPKAHAKKHTPKPKAHAKKHAPKPKAKAHAKKHAPKPKAKAHAKKPAKAAPKPKAKAHAKKKAAPKPKAKAHPKKAAAKKAHAFKPLPKAHGHHGHRHGHHHHHHHVELFQEAADDVVPEVEPLF